MPVIASTPLTMAVWTPTVLALGLLATACPADVAIDDPSTGSETSGGSTAQITSGSSVPTTSSGPELTSTGPENNSTGGSTAELSATMTNGESTDGSSTSGGSTTGSSTGGSSTGDPNPGSSTTGDPSMGTSTGDASTSSSTTADGSTSSSESSSGDESTTGEEEELGAIELCCEVGCSTTLLQSAVGAVKVRHNGSRIVTHDVLSNLVLWDAATLVPLYRADKVDSAELVGDTLVYQRKGTLHVVDAAAAAEFAACPAASTFGVALDESYLWTAGPAGIEVIEPTCELRWGIAGPAGTVKALAAPDRLHVFSSGKDLQSVAHYEASDGTVETVAFVGDFGGWFADVPRYWTTQGQAYHLYDVDGAQLVFTIGAPIHGWGTRLVLGNSVQDIFTKQTSYGFGSMRPSGPAVLTFDGGLTKAGIVRLDEDPIAITPIETPCCASYFAFAEDKWVVGDLHGYSADQLGRLVTFGKITALSGSSAGRVAARVDDKNIHVFDVDGGLCSATVYPPVARPGNELLMANSGSLLLSGESWKNPNKPDDPLVYPGTRYYALPGLEKLAEGLFTVKTGYIADREVAEHGDAVARVSYYISFEYSANSFPFGTSYGSGQSSVVPKFAPDLAHVVRSDAKQIGPYPNWAGSFSYIHAPTDLVAAFEGVAHGFLDDEHILVGRYKVYDDFDKLEIVGLDGVLVKSTTLPDIRKMTRIGTGEILATLHPSGDQAIYDPFTGDLLWTAPPKTTVALAGPDHVVISDVSRVQLVRWR